MYLTFRSQDPQFKASPQPIPFNRYNVSRILLILVIVLVNGAQFGYDLAGFIYPNQFHQVSLADLTSSVLNVFTQ